MYVLKPDEFCNYDLSNINQFINFWNGYYDEKAAKDIENDKPIVYIRELNLGRPLTKQNIIRLLRWKSARHYTYRNNELNKKKKSYLRVKKVISQRKNLNHFREGTPSEDKFKGITGRIFNGGSVMRIFLFHICKPYKYPIIDRYVVQAYCCHTGEGFPLGNNLERNWEHYMGYRKYFFEIANAYYNHNDNYKWDMNDTERLKKIDNALMAFGQFLNEYDNVVE